MCPAFSKLCSKNGSWITNDSEPTGPDRRGYPSLPPALRLLLQPLATGCDERGAFHGRLGPRVSGSSRLGVLHLHLTGGEPAARTDLPELIAGGRQAGLYTNLITSGIGLSEPRLAELVDAGLDHIQLSFQDSQGRAGRWIAGAKGHAYKVALAEKIRQ